MHRFRKKSDAKRAQIPENILSSNSWSQQPTLANQPHNSPDKLFTLPPVSDFRTSLILPSLSRRFTLLRNSDGSPVSLDDMRTRFAEQRARGAEHQISEEEEEVLVQALSEMRAVNATGSRSPLPPTQSNTATPFSSIADTFSAQQDASPHPSAGGDSDYPTSIISGIAPSIASSTSSMYPRSIPSTSSNSRTSGSPRYSSKRNSNNLFGSGRFHDTSYLHSVSKASVGSSRSAISLAGSDSQHGGSVGSMRSVRDAEAGLQAVAQDDDTNADPSATSDKAASSEMALTSQYMPLLTLPPRSSKEFTVQQVRRTSLALEQVIRGIEEEAEETIMVPRRSLSRTGTVNSRTQSPKLSDPPSAAGTPVPWMTDEARVDDRDDEDRIPSSAPPTSVTSISPSSSPSPGPYPRPGTTSPTPRLPGYIPGMTRPLTPRDADSDRDDGATGYSTTPRARSPAQPHYSHHSNHSLSFSSSRHRHHSSLSSESQSILPPSILRPSRVSPQVPPLRATSPGFGHRSRGNSTSGPQVPSPAPSPSPEERFKSDLLARRPLSPLTGAAVSTGHVGPRPGTPSGGGAWAPTPSSPLAQMHMISPTPPRENGSPRPDANGHSRNGSFISADAAHGDSMSVPIPLSSPTLLDSSLIESRQGSNAGVFSPFGAWINTQNPSQNRSGGTNTNTVQEVYRNSSISSFDLGQAVNSPRSAAAAKIAARAPTPVHTHSRSPTASDSLNGHEPILLNRTVSKRSQKRIRSSTPPPHIQSLTQTPVALHTPSSSSNSSSNVNVNLYSSTSPLFSPMLNTSTSSLLSVGSSYHSWADENIKKSGWDQLVEYDSQRSAWQDIMNSGGGAANDTDDASETEALGSPEQMLCSATGLTKADLAAVQKRLATDALSRKGGFDPPRSPIRRRRMSASRASLSATPSGRESGTNSPAPPPRQATPVEEDSHSPPSPESTSRANALLDSVLNSIQAMSTPSTPASTPASSDVTSVEPPSSADDDSSSKLPSISSSGRESHEGDTSAIRLKALADALSVNEQPSDNEPEPVKQVLPTLEPFQSHEEDSGEATEVPISHVWRSPPQPPALNPPSSSAQLEQDVSRKATAATEALKSSSQSKSGGPEGTLRRRPTKRIDLQQISSPHLVSSSTSVNAIPITHQNLSPQSPTPPSDPRSPLKLSQRFKKLRGTLRTKPNSRDGDEVTPFILPGPTSKPQVPHASSPPLHRFPSPTAPAQTLEYTQNHVPPASATEQGRFKVPVPSPPASAGPGLKGFMARFRKSRKDSGKEAVIPGDRSGPQSPEPTSPVSPPHERDHAQVRQGALSSAPVMAKPRRSHDHVSNNTTRARSPSPDPATVNQLFKAAHELGLDPRAVDDLLARSTSTSSRNTNWTRVSASAFAGTRSNSTTSRPTPLPREDHSLDQPRSLEQSYKPPARPNAMTNRQPEGEIVRRTIIFASDNPSTPDLSGLGRKDFASGRPQRSSSATSVHSTGSATREPPVPRLPSNLGRTHSAKPSDASSFYSMYPPEHSVPGVQNGSAEGPSSVPVEGSSYPGEHGQGPALEVLQLSNGQVVWSVLDSLRAEDEDDSESFFRRSMASSRGNDAGDDLEVRVKEHRRWDSKGSNLSQGSHNSRRRQIPGSSGARPETKLFKTNSSTIGRLIEDLSKNMDSGSFNFMRPATATPPTSTSFHSDASGPSRQVERDLEALLNAINPHSGS